MDDISSTLMDIVSPELEAVLALSPTGLSEYQLILALRQRGLPQFQREAFATALSLFQTHFMLFHLLYRLDQRLREERRGHLDIHCLRIIWVPYQTAETQGLPALDPGLSQYYLNLSNLRETTADDVDALVAAFWLRFVTADERSAALSVLELEDPVDDATIERQYRRLAQRLHPDRGGDTAAFQALSGAMRVLRR